MILSHKKNHFVPRVYLKQWTQSDKGNITLFTLSLKDKLSRKQSTKEIAQKKNLYTLPLTHPFEIRKISEQVLYKIWEDNWPSVIDPLEKNSELTGIQIHNLISFVIIQSFRTPKFAKENQAIIQKTNNPEITIIKDSYMFAYLATKGYADHVKNATCEILYTNDLKKFITSDNPATHWLKNDNQFTYIAGTALRNDLRENKNYKIIWQKYQL